MTPDQYRREGFRLGIEAAARIVENGYRCESCGQVFLGNSGHSDTDCSQGYSNWDNATDTDKAAAIRAIDVDEVLAGLSPPAPAPAEQEPVAVIGKDYRLLWSDAGSMSEIVAKHRITVGSPLYAHPAPVPAVPDDAQMPELLPCPCQGSDEMCPCQNRLHARSTVKAEMPYANDAVARPEMITDPNHPAIDAYWTASCNPAIARSLGWRRSVMAGLNAALAAMDTDHD